MKKTLALVLAFALVFSTMTVAFAEDAALSADAKICADLGMLVGDGSGVTAAYTATAPNRIQSAVMFLRLKGLEAEAKAFTGEANFADADKAAWAKPIMAYLKANPQLGWQGDGTNFNPTNPITAKEYYKVMLQALGYVQSSATVAGGDFSWDNVIEFAATKGLTKAATVASFTINDVAVATVEALKANMKEGGKTLVASLVDAGKVDKAKAVAAGLYTEAAATTAKLVKVLAVGNTKVMAEFDTAVDKAFAENVANYKIDGLEVKAAVLDGTKQVVLETAAQTAGKAYKLTVGAVAINFAGVAKVTSTPEIDSVEGTDTDRVVVTFTTGMDLATALDKANYTVTGPTTVTVESIAWDDHDSRDAVELTTKGMTAGKTYKVAVANLKSVDLVTLKSASKNFTATSDKKAPAIKDADSRVMTNTRMYIAFTDDNELVKEAAENVANYKITYGTNGNSSLDITSVKLVEDANDDMKAIEITTASQKSGTKYKVHVNGLVDTSVLANKMTKEDTIELFGKKADTDEPSLGSVTYLSDTVIKVELKDNSRLDAATVLDANNYTLNNDVAVEKVEWTDADDADCHTVKLTVSELVDDKSYTVTVKNVEDEYGNAMDSDKVSKHYDKDAACAVSTVKRTETNGNDEVVIIFTKELDAATAEDIANYAINGDIGAPKEAEYDAENSDYGSQPTVTLTTAELVENNNYTVTINGVKDIAGNVLADLVGEFTVGKTANDTERPEIDDVEAVNDSVIRVTFSEDMNTDIASVAKVKIGTSTYVYADYAESYESDDSVLEFTMRTPFGTNDGDVTLVDVVYAADLAGNPLDPDNGMEFASTDDNPDDVELDAYDQTSAREFKLQFSENVRLADAAYDKITANGVTFTVSVDDDDDSIIWLTGNKAMDDGDTFDINLDNFDGVTNAKMDWLENYHGQKVANVNTTTKTTLEANMDDTDDPYIDKVNVNDRNEVEIVFNEPMSSKGAWLIKYDDKDGKAKTITPTASLDSDTVTLSFTTNLESRYNYTLTVTTAPKDMAGNSLDKDAEYDFAGTDVVAIGNYVKGVKIYNATKIKAYTFSKTDATSVTALVYKDEVKTGNEVDVATTPVETSTNTDGFTFNVNTDVYNSMTIPVDAFMEDTTYVLQFNDNGSVYEYEFEGLADQDVDVSVSGAAYEVSYSDSEAGDVVAFVYQNAVAVADAVYGDGDTVTMNAVGLNPVTDPVTVIVVRNGVVIHIIHDVNLSELN